MPPKRTSRTPARSSSGSRAASASGSKGRSAGASGTTSRKAKTNAAGTAAKGTKAKKSGGEQSAEADPKATTKPKRRSAAKQAAPPRASAVRAPAAPRGEPDRISVRGAREHNLRGVDIDLPRDRLVVITGLSGSGKSSLAFDTIYAEGQRRYVESLSSYARQFLGQMDKPDVDFIEGLSPAISIDQKSASRNPRSTVGTITEVWDYLRLLFARIGVPHCPV